MNRTRRTIALTAIAEFYHNINHVFYKQVAELISDAAIWDGLTHLDLDGERSSGVEEIDEITKFYKTMTNTPFVGYWTLERGWK